MTLGTGSFDVPLATAVFYRKDPVVLEGTIEYILRTEGDNSYRYGNDLRWRGSVGFLAIDDPDVTMLPKLALSGIHKEADSLKGHEDQNSGQDLLLLGPELKVSAINRFDIVISVEVPVAHRNNGLQALQDHLVRLSFESRL